MLPHADIAKQATIYGGNCARELTAYEQAINEASIGLALDNPILLGNRGALIKQAKTRLLETDFAYKRGRSRSKLLPATPYTSTNAKRAAHAQAQSDARRSRIQALQQTIQTGSTDMEEPKAELSRLRLQERKYKWYVKRKAP
jgi:hypothetical protein